MTTTLAPNRAAKALRLVDTITAAHPGMSPFHAVTTADGS